jgi:hypothetical protein
MARKSRLPPLGDVPTVLPPRTTADGVTVHYATVAEACVVCRLPAYTRVDEIPLHSDRCLDYHRKAG